MHWIPRSRELDLPKLRQAVKMCAHLPRAGSFDMRHMNGHLLPPDLHVVEAQLLALIPMQRVLTLVTLT